jgi:hypothetical protein
MNIYIKIGFLASLLILTGAFVLVYINFGDVGNLFIVHFDAYKGIDFLGGKGDVFGILGISLVILALNFLLASVSYPRDRFLSYLISFSSILFAILIFIGIIVIINVN